VIIVGGGNHCRDIQEIAHRLGLHSLTVYDDDSDTGWPIPGDFLHGPLLIGVNDSDSRREIAKRFSYLRGAAPLIDPSAILGRDVHCGRGTVIAPMVSLLHSVTLGDHVHVNTLAQMVRTNVGDFSTISPGAAICGNVEIGEACTIGANATVCERVTIGNDVLVAAGAIVPPYSIVPDKTRVLGVFK
jgi:NDP-sugar pyrophosphorylase family protein